MSTGGVYGFRYNNIDKVTYNHSDSYPTYLGKHIINFIRNYSDLEMKKVFYKIELVNEEDEIPDELKEKYIKYSRVNNPSDWYELLRFTQGNLEVYMKDVDHMIDSRDFLGDSLFCEWAYIINLNISKLEIYKGFNKNPKAKGRYVKMKNHFAKDGYYGVSLLEKLSFKSIRSMTPDMIDYYCIKLKDLKDMDIDTYNIQKDKKKVIKL